jgi:hypothetical protein
MMARYKVELVSAALISGVAAAVLSALDSGVTFWGVFVLLMCSCTISWGFREFFPKPSALSVGAKAYWALYAFGTFGVILVVGQLICLLGFGAFELVDVLRPMLGFGVASVVLDVFKARGGK